MFLELSALLLYWERFWHLHTNLTNFTVCRTSPLLIIFRVLLKKQNKKQNTHGIRATETNTMVVILICANANMCVK